MEKDIELLEDMRDNIYGAMQFEDDYQVTELEEKQFNALNLAIKSINRVKELENEVEKQKEIIKKYENYTRLRSVVDFYNKNPKNDFISKDKIKEKIEDNEMLKKIESTAKYTHIELLQYSINQLQDLLN